MTPKRPERPANSVFDIPAGLQQLLAGLQQCPDILRIYRSDAGLSIPSRYDELDDSPRVLLRSFLLRFMDSTRCAWRLSRQMTGSPS